MTPISIPSIITALSMTDGIDTIESYCLFYSEFGTGGGFGRGITAYVSTPVQIDKHDLRVNGLQVKLEHDRGRLPKLRPEPVPKT